MAIDQFGPDAARRAVANAAEAGNLSIAHRGEHTVAALAQNDVAAISKIPKNSLVLGLHYSHAAMGATTGLKFGYASEDGEDEEEAAFVTVADSSAAGVGVAWVVPFVTTKDLYVTATQTGAGTGAGKITAQALYVFQGGD